MCIIWIPWATDACKIEFGSVLNLNTCGIFLITFKCLLCHSIPVKNVVILFIFGTANRYYALLMFIKLHLALRQI